ncbi:extracellular catalytic domain type 1 short-chain-length polyhydroxyalkanoate depolymerase [Sphingobium phenoxybenzoativorans]|uniref:extracellular catalytic domain type 1 short-chain-length polyhydroxyalkanoate depolymerase n=1 Tax=Sphingobium phenoxybenzoativorans TaxID=1592790 RepID=UPI0008720477|nr:PHB depolymerase family esterase [Sphingobium phenoxybenzoativorans]
MPRLSDAIARLSQLSGSAAGSTQHAEASRLKELCSFCSNPGQLRASTYVPAELEESPALVVVLHGCTQTAAGYDVGSGWSQLSDRFGFVLLFPEQQRQNNPNLCFNWFSAEDNRREGGEALSIRQMIAAVANRHDIDPARIFVTGLSAGGAMASVMLATYPELFAGGAIIAGLPYGCADTIPEALSLMRGRGGLGEAELARLIRSASDHGGPWPTISIWHGSGDATVNPVNSDAIISQWRGLHGVGLEPDRTEAVDGYPRRVWRNDDDREVIEEYSITGMGHGTPLDTLNDGCGRSGPYMLEASISSTHRICEFWGLATVEPLSSPEIAMPASATLVRTTMNHHPLSVTPLDQPPIILPTPADPSGVGRIIEDALRAAGLMR